MGIVGVMMMALGGCKPQATTRVAPAKWEYKVVQIANVNHKVRDDAMKKSPIDIGVVNYADETDGEFSYDIYELGYQGWELVAAIPQTETVDSLNKKQNVRTGNVHLIFKRPAEVK